MQVRAIKLGYYEHKRRKPGQEFTLVEQRGKKIVDPKGRQLVDVVLSPVEQFSPVWMEKVEENEEPRKGRPQEPEKKHRRAQDAEVI